ncbi:rhodanese-like domain-containing protein [Subtercola sp. PAMC28395]|uniref:rhodanese-like domain-containing protein n=1 Tax=Subtercola sp. PAMC28395 TaxID=2846775 RepID=UPI001C0D10DC|nr:rhodanese-like domain-containing protein [Subtercola sp. PAMC28395]QWT23964.1 rhodanese-like domain-containing protein [Subtercola sp. PAMC28395]
MNEITVTQLSELQGATLIDVREPDEYAAVRVPGAINIPLGTLADAQLPEGEVYVICQLGGRSAKATEYLSGAGVTATNIAGGTAAWVQAGLPTDSGTA